MKTITQKEWENTHRDYKTIVKGQKKILKLTQKGTSLVPVKIKERI